MTSRVRFSFLAPNFRGENKSQISLQKKFPGPQKGSPGNFWSTFQKPGIGEFVYCFRLEINGLNFCINFDNFSSPEQWGIEIDVSDQIFEGQRCPFLETWRFPEVPRGSPSSVKAKLMTFFTSRLEIMKKHFFLQYRREVPRGSPVPRRKMS